MKNHDETRIENIGIQVNVPVVANDVPAINYQLALASYPEEEQKQIIALADSIDVRQIEKVMNYGSEPLRATFEQCGQFLKNERGSEADQRVVVQVIELSKKASSTYEDFQLVLKEPNLLQKAVLKIINGGKTSRTKKIQKSAITNFNLLGELKASCDVWLDMLKKAMGEIEYSFISDMETIGLLEKYIIAGNIAEERISRELKKMEEQYQQTGLQRHSQEYDELCEGNKIFMITLANLEKSRIMYHLSLGQLSLIIRGNRNVQISIHTQVDNSMALISQQLRNALLNAKTQEVLEGQKAITRLNDELIKAVSENTGLTAKEAEKLIYTGFYSVEAAKTAITTVITSCEEIKKTATEMLPKMKADMTQLNGLIEQLEPYIHEVKTLESENSTESASISTSANASGNLKF